MIAHRVNPAFLKTNWLFSAFLICFFFFISLINRRFGHHELFVGWKARTMRHVRCRWFVPCDSWRKCLKHCRCQDELARFAQDLKERLILKFWQTDWLIKFTLDHLTIQNNYPGWVYNELCLNKCCFSNKFKLARSRGNVFESLQMRHLPAAIEWSCNSWLAAVSHISNHFQLQSKLSALPNTEIHK